MPLQVFSKSVLVEDEFRREAGLCKRIINKISGYVTLPTRDPSQKFDLFFKWAKQNPDQFDIEMMSDVTSPSDEEGNITWIQSDLDRMSFPELKKIGLNLSVTARDKETLIKRILAKQAKTEEEE